MLKPDISNCGYLRVRLYGKNECRRFSIHRLVAEAFIDNPENKPEVNHLDGNKTNNNVENLEWATSKENMRHSILLGKVMPKYGKHKGSKPVVQLSIDGSYIAEFSSCSEAADKTNSNKHHIANVCGKRRKTTNGFKWVFKKDYNG